MEFTTTEESENIYDTKKDGDAPEPVIPVIAVANVTEAPPEPVTSTIAPDITDEELFAFTSTTAVVELSTDNPCFNGDEAEECKASACANHLCGPNGECIPINGTSYECKCKLYYDGPRCDLFKPIERAARFDGDAFIEISADEFPHLTSEKEEIVEMKFRTKKGNGVLFWQGQQPGTSVVGEDYFSVGLVDGHLHFSYELGGGAAHMATEQRVDDDKEHVIRLIRKGRRGILKLDDYPEQRGLSSGILAMLNADGNIFIGKITVIS
ncbi:laminin G domain protein [Oesophagostomum dentatum]|uniref:Laminin G domain protein n=1 Tax=Oesophagostomum dentatum TaxID=61180 RepID=A0A0B1TCN5_OESDE|nr:laminin G domain protein [Oesophagostomum dentatum]